MNTHLAIYQRRLASDDPQDAAILEERSQEVRTRDAKDRLEALTVLMDMRERWGSQWIHDVVLSLAACQGENVCGRELLKALIQARDFIVDEYPRASMAAGNWPTVRPFVEQLDAAIAKAEGRS